MPSGHNKAKHQHQKSRNIKEKFFYEVNGDDGTTQTSSGGAAGGGGRVGNSIALKRKNIKLNSIGVIQTNASPPFMASGSSNSVMCNVKGK